MQLFPVSFTYFVIILGKFNQIKRVEFSPKKRPQEHQPALKTSDMALARLARTGFRRSGGAINNCANEKDVVFESVLTQKCSSPCVENVLVSGNPSHLSNIKKAHQMNFWCRGIRISPQSHFPQAERIVEDSDPVCESPRYPTLEATKPGEKPRVVVLGTGWAACRFLKGLDTKIYDVVCISPRNHMVFTPLLASTTVGTLEFRSVAEPVGRIQTALSKDPNSFFYLASCTGVDTDKHEVSTSSSFIFRNVEYCHKSMITTFSNLKLD